MNWAPIRFHYKIRSYRLLLDGYIILKPYIVFLTWISFCNLIIYHTNPRAIRLYTKYWPYYRTRPFTELWDVSIVHLRRVWHADRTLTLDIWPHPISDLPMYNTFIPILFPNLSWFFRTIHFQLPSVLSRFCFAQGDDAWDISENNKMEYYRTHYWQHTVLFSKRRSFIRSAIVRINVTVCIW